MGTNRPTLSPLGLRAAKNAGSGTLDIDFLCSTAVVPQNKQIGPLGGRIKFFWFNS